MLVLSLGLFLQRIVLPRVKMDLPTSVSIIMTVLHRHGQRLCPLRNGEFSQADDS